MNQAARVVTASAARLEIGGVSYEFCNQMLLGLASIRARQLETDLIPLAVWNGQTGDGPGGAASVVEDWKSLGLKPLIINLPMDERAAQQRQNWSPEDSQGRESRSSADTTSPNAFNSRVVAIPFADAIG